MDSRPTPVVSGGGGGCSCPSVHPIISEHRDDGVIGWQDLGHIRPQLASGELLQLAPRSQLAWIADVWLSTFVR